MKFSEFADQSAKELRKKKTELRAQMFEAKMKNSMGQLQSPASIKNMRRDIAKIFTALKQAQLKAEVKAPAKVAVKAKAPKKDQSVAKKK